MEMIVCLIVEEVFGTLQYGLVEEEPSIVIDFGLNVGVAVVVERGVTTN
jgi:hypothetical protein